MGKRKTLFEERGKCERSYTGKELFHEFDFVMASFSDSQTLRGQK